MLYFEKIIKINKFSAFKQCLNKQIINKKNNFMFHIVVLYIVQCLVSEMVQM